jgi:hypothetical protein
LTLISSASSRVQRRAWLVGFPHKTLHVNGPVLLTFFVSPQERLAFEMSPEL